MYCQNHTRTIMNSEKKTTTDVYNKLHNDNLVSDRNIRQGKLAATKKQKIVNEMKEERDRLHEDVDILNKDIFDNCWEKDKQTRKLHDRNLTKKAIAEKMQAAQEANLVEIDISIATSRIKDLENQKEMSET